MTVEQIASVIYNDVVGGLSGIKINHNMSIEQLSDEIIIERLIIIKEYMMKNILPKKDLMQTIVRLETDCKALDSTICANGLLKPSLHVEIPLILNDLNEDSVEYMGTIDKETPFKVYTSTAYTTHKYLRRGANSPYIYIHPTPNGNNKYDAWIYNMPMLKYVTITAIFKDPRQLEEYECCGEDVSNMNFIDNEIIKRLTEKKLRVYRQLAPQPTPNDQVAR